MSHRSHIAKIGDIAIIACSAAWSPPSKSSPWPSISSLIFSGIMNHMPTVEKESGGRLSGCSFDDFIVCFGDVGVVDFGCGEFA